MRVCPKCLYVDPPEWRHSYYRPWIDITAFDQFEALLPDLAKQLLPNGKFEKRIVEDDLYKYRLNKTGNIVERIAKIDSLGKGFRGPDTEKPKKYHSLNQRRLLDSSESSKEEEPAK